MSIFDPDKIARVKAMTDAMPAWKKGQPMPQPPKETLPRVTDKQCHDHIKVCQMTGNSGVFSTKLALDLLDARAVNTQLLEALKYMEKNLAKSDYSGDCIHCGGSSQCKPSCPLFHMKAAIQAAEVQE